MRFFPESLFSRRLDEDAERRLRLAQARAEDRIVDAHVTNALMFVDALAEDLSFDRAIDTYVRVMGIPEPLASAVATRTLVILGQELVPTRLRRASDVPRRDQGETANGTDEPRLWLRTAGPPHERAAGDAEAPDQDHTPPRPATDV